MNKKLIAGFCTLALCGLSGAQALPGTATADTLMHTRRLVLDSMAETSIVGTNSFGGTDIVKAQGKIVGYDAISGRFYPKQAKVILHEAFALQGGILICRLIHTGSGPSDVTLTGPIIKGSGRYNGAKGTITWREVQRDRVRVTLRFHY